MSVHHLDDDIFAGEAVTIRVGPVTAADGTAIDLSTASGFECEVKKRAGDADPALISKSGASIATVGTTHLDITILPADTAGMSGLHYYDVTATIAGARRFIVHPSRFRIIPTVNRP